MDVILVDELMCRPVPWKKWKYIKKPCCTGLSAFLFLMKKGKCCCKKERIKNITVPGLWTNACCSHPKPGEETIEQLHKSPAGRNGI